LSITSIKNHVKRAMEDMPSTVRYTRETDGQIYDKTVNGQTGYKFSPATVRLRAWYEDIIYDDKMYFISDINVSEFGTNYVINFSFGPVDIGDTSMDEYFYAGFQIDQTTGLLVGDPSFELHSKAGIAETWSTFPPPPVLSSVPNPVNDGLKIFNYSRDINEWMTAQGFDDPTAAKLQMTSYLMCVLEQVALGVRSDYLGQPKSLLDVIAARAGPIRQYIRRWPDGDSSLTGNWDDNDYITTSKNGTEVRFWRPTLFTYAENWMMVVKVDHPYGDSISKMKDDHVVVFMEGSYDADNFSDGFLSIGPVLGISSMTSYQSSGGEGFTTTEITPSGTGEDMLQDWIAAFGAENQDKPADIVNMASETTELLQDLMTDLQSLDGNVIQGVYSVSDGGHGDVHFTASGDGNVFAGCSGHVYLLSTLGTPRILDSVKLYSDNKSVRLMGGAGVLVAGINGIVYFLDPHNISDKDSIGQVTLGRTGRTALLAVGDRLFAGCSGYVYELDMNDADAGYVWYNHLEKIVPDAGDNDVRLAASNQTLFVSTHGYIFAYDISGETPLAITNSSKSYFDLSQYGNTATPMTVSRDGAVFASVNAYVMRLNLSDYSFEWVTDLEDVKSEIGENLADLICLDDDVLLAGCNGYGVRLSIETGAALDDEEGKDHYSLHDQSHGITNVAHNGVGGLAACNGYAYYLNPNYYDTTTDLSEVVGATFKKQVVSLDSDKDTTIFEFGGTVYVGVAGKVYSLPAL